MKDIKDFDLNITNESNDVKNDGKVNPQSTGIISTIAWSIIGISHATTQFGGDATWTEAPKC